MITTVHFESYWQSKGVLWESGAATESEAIEQGREFGERLKLHCVKFYLVHTSEWNKPGITNIQVQAWDDKSREYVPVTEHRHEMQPYGWVKMTDCKFECRDFTWIDYNNGSRERKGREVVVSGTVVESSYCGALLFGVPVVTPNSNRYPPGSQYQCRIKGAWDFVNGFTIDVAM